MALYTKKNSEFVRLSRPQIRRMRRTNESNQLVNDAALLARCSRALATWMDTVNKRAGALNSKDVFIVRTANADRFREMADNVDKAIEALRRS